MPRSNKSPLVAQCSLTSGCLIAVGGVVLALVAISHTGLAQEPYLPGARNVPVYRLVLPNDREKPRPAEPQHTPAHRLVLPEDSLSGQPNDRPSQPLSTPAIGPGDTTSGSTNRRPIFELRLQPPSSAPIQSEIRPTGLPPEALPVLAPLPASLIPGPRPTALQPQKPEVTKPPLPAAYVEPLEVPEPERLFRLESEYQLRERIRQEQRDYTARAVFPTDVPTAPPGTTYQGRDWPRLVNTIPAAITAYQPLYFEDKNVERYGWDAGIFQPFLSTGKFCLDLALLPYNLGAQPPWSLEYNAGYALPGDPEPYRLYLPRCSMTGASLEALAVLGIIALP